MVLPDSYGVSRAPHYSGYVYSISAFWLRDCYPLRCAFPSTSPTLIRLKRRPTTPERQAPLVWAVPRSLAATDGITIVFSSSGYLDVSVPLVCLRASYVFRCRCMRMNAYGFPHSDIPGSKLAYSSPRHFVVRHVLHRLLAPRHPPCALNSLTTVF